MIYVLGWQQGVEIRDASCYETWRECGVVAFVYCPFSVRFTEPLAKPNVQ